MRQLRRPEHEFIMYRGDKVVALDAPDLDPILAGKTGVVTEGGICWCTVRFRFKARLGAEGTYNEDWPFKLADPGALIEPCPLQLKKAGPERLRWRRNE